MARALSHRTSIGQNTSALRAREDLQYVFEEVDKDKNGSIDEKELHKMFKRLNIVLADPVEDVRSLFMIMDMSKLGAITSDAFCSVFEVCPARARAHNGTAAGFIKTERTGTGTDNMPCVSRACAVPTRVRIPVRVDRRTLSSAPQSMALSTWT